MTRKKDGTYANPAGGTITAFGDPDGRFESQYGLTTYRAWCEREIERMAERRTVRVAYGKGLVETVEGRACRIVTAPDGKIALAEEGDDGKSGMQQEGVGPV